MATGQGKYWLLTIPHHQFTPYLPKEICFIRGQLEQGRETGFLHWQLLAITNRKLRLRGVTAIFGTGIHAELSRSSAADEYVWKEDTRIEGTQFELGTRPLRRNCKEDWDRIWELAKSGGFEEIEPQIRIQHYRTFRTIRADYAKPIGMERIVYVFWGRTGTGKSRRAWDEAGMDAYPKDPRTKWWDGYQGHKFVVCDEFRGSIDIAHLLRWVDRYPVLVEIKGASIPLVAEKIWLTSNLDPRLWYPEADEETKAALMRRLNITHFP